MLHQRTNVGVGDWTEIIKLHGKYFSLWANLLAPSLVILSSWADQLSLLDSWDRTSLCGPGWPQTHNAFQAHFKCSVLFPWPHWHYVWLNYFLLISVPLALIDPISSTVAKVKYADINQVLARCLDHSKQCKQMLLLPLLVKARWFYDVFLKLDTKAAWSSAVI